MRTLKLLALGIALVLAIATQVKAQTPEVLSQTPPQQPAAQSPRATRSAAAAGRYYFNVNLGGQLREETFTTSSTFRLHNETGAVATAQSIGGGTLFDVGAGGLVWRNLAVGIAYSTVDNKNDATSAVRVPHPVISGQPREATATAADLSHSENVVHLQFVWIMPLTEKIDVAFSAGPSFFTVRQDIATVIAPQDIRDTPPFTTVSITNITVTEVKDSPVGFNIGIDATYAITTYRRIQIGVGIFGRFTQAGIDLPVPDGLTLEGGDLNAGGGQGGIGLRLRF